MQLFFFDTETTGLPDWHKPSDSPTQPHICQLTALLTNAEGNKLSSMDTLIRPVGWKIPDDVAAIHGITTERADAGGVRIEEVLPVFLGLWVRARIRIAHNESFDARMLRIELKRHGPASAPDEWKAGEKFCTMHGATKHCKVPPTPKMVKAGRSNQFKAPTLAEAYLHFTGQSLGDKAHNAMYDVMACRAIYFKILEAEGKSPKASLEPEPAEAGDDDDELGFLAAAGE